MNPENTTPSSIQKEQHALKKLKERVKEGETLLSLSSEIAYVQVKQDLLPVLQQHLRAVGFSDDLAISILNEDGKTFKRFVNDATKPRVHHPAYKKVVKAKYPYPDGFFEMIMGAKIPMVFYLKDLLRNEPVPYYLQFLYETGIREIVSISLKDRSAGIGGLFIFSKKKRKYSAQQLKVVQGIANQVGVAVSNIRAYEQIAEKELEKSFLLAVSRELTSCKNKADVLAVVNNRLTKLVHCDIILICLNNVDKVTHSNYLHTIPKEIEQHPDFVTMATLKYYIDDGFYNIIQASEDPMVFDVDELVSRTNKPFYFDFWHANDIKEMVGLSIRVNNETIGAVVLHAKEKDTFNMSELKVAQGVCSQIGIILSNMKAYEKIESQLKEIDQYKSRLEEENFYLQEQIKNTYHYNEMVGSSRALQQVFHLVSQVAASVSTVLILGETGTGKELIARAIHNASPRKDKMMVKINCAALPAQLIESELFGHEKGSFTGATERRIGKFELANNGTLFLDEVGEMPLELQVKLLRAIQEREIERVGGRTVIKTDVRIIVATNRNLQKEVEEGRFRSDLFYRLNVFPITLTPLRERREDIPALVAHFINRLSRKLGKNITNISQKALNDLMQYHWPGNVRELEHLIERSILLTNGTTIKEISLPQNNRASLQLQTEELPLKSLEQNEREHILTALKKSKGKIRGDGGAAILLGLPPTTLHSKMKKLGITKSHE